MQVYIRCGDGVVRPVENQPNSPMERDYITFMIRGIRDKQNGKDVRSSANTNPAYHYALIEQAKNIYKPLPLASEEELLSVLKHYERHA